MPCLRALQLGLQVMDPSPQLPVLHFLDEDFLLVRLCYTLLQITPDLLQTVHVASSDRSLDLRYRPNITSLLLDPVALDCSPPAASILETTLAGLGEGGACSSS